MTLVQMADRFFSEYTVSKTVKIRSRWLRVPEVALNTAIFLYIVMYQMVYNLQFIKMDAAKATTNMNFRGAMENWNSCSYSLGNCKMLPPDPKDYTYCKESLVKGCQVKEIDDISAPSFTSAEIATVQSCCGKGNHSHYYIAGAEDYLMKFRFLVESSDSEGPSFAVGSMPGFLKNHKGELQPISACKQQGPCQVMNRSALWSAGYADFYGIGTLVAAAGVDLNDRRPRLTNTTQTFASPPTWRFTGVNLMLNVIFTNADRADFWMWPFGLKPKYIIEPVHLRLADESAGGTFDFGRRGMNGITFVVKAGGTVGSFKLIYVLTALVVSSALFSLSSFLVSSVLVRMYSLSDQLQLAAVMHDHYKSEYSLMEEDLRKSVATGQHDLTELENQVRAKRLADLAHHSVQD